MAGNVAEWTSSAFDESASTFVHDMAPSFDYEAKQNDPPVLKRKVVRGGSFVSNAKALSPYARDYQLQNVAHCFVGFRCVMGAPEILNKEVATRKNSKKHK